MKANINLVSVFIIISIFQFGEAELDTFRNPKIPTNSTTLEAFSEFLMRNDLNGHKLFRVQADSNDKVGALQKLFGMTKALDFWNLPSRNDFTDIMVGWAEEQDFLGYLKRFAMNYSVAISNIESLVLSQLSGMTKQKKMGWTEYHYTETIYSWLEELPFMRSSVSVEKFTIGKSTEGRPIILIKISNGGDEKKPGVFIDGGIHAREWISSAVATYIVNEFVRNGTEYEDILDKFDVFVVPMLNPDGYAHTCSYNRLWRKSRSSNKMFTNFLGCRGVDLNRNFGYTWGGRGQGSFPCSIIYGGTEPFSAPETLAVKDFIESDLDREWMAYFSLHSFGQKWLTPWGHTKVLPEDYDEMVRVANIGVKALKAVHGTRYTVGSTQNVLYTASGSSADWFKGAVKVPYSYTMELRDYGLFGFLLPKSQIIPTAEETWAGIQAALRAIPDY